MENTAAAFPNLASLSCWYKNYLLIVPSKLDFNANLADLLFVTRAKRASIIDSKTLFLPLIMTLIQDLHFQKVMSVSLFFQSLVIFLCWIYQVPLQ